MLQNLLDNLEIKSKFINIHSKTIRDEDSGFKIWKLARFLLFDDMKYHQKCFFCENRKHGVSDHFTVFYENYFDGLSYHDIASKEFS